MVHLQAINTFHGFTCMYNDVMIYQIIVTCDLMRRCFITMWLLKLWSIGKIGSATWILVKI